MSARKQFQTGLPENHELIAALAKAKDRGVSEAELHEQRISFAYGNAPDSKLITKDSVRHSSERVRLRD